MGDSLIETIPIDPDEYHKWLQALRELYTKWETLLQTFLSIKPESLNNIETDKSRVEILDEAFDARLEEFPTFKPQFLISQGEYTYTFDLDLEVFSIDSSAHYWLQHVPRNREWIKGICRDEEGLHFVHPRLAPEKSLARLTVNLPKSSANEGSQKPFPTKQVNPKSGCSTASDSIRFKIFDVFEDSQLSGLRLTLNSWTVDDLCFRELAFFILCIAAGGDYLSLIDQRRTRDPHWTDLYSVIIHGEGSPDKREFITSVGNGFHLSDQPQGTAPSTSKYWFHGALVSLVPRLKEPGRMESAIADTVRYGRDVCGRASFNALLISIADLVLIRSFPDGSVEHSPIMHLISTFGSIGQDARSRYRNHWLDTFYDEEMVRREKADKEAEVEAARKQAAIKERKARRKAKRHAARKAAKDLAKDAEESGNNGEPGSSQIENPSESENDSRIDGESEDTIKALSDTGGATAALDLEDDKEASWSDLDAADSHNDAAIGSAKNEDHAVAPERYNQAESTTCGGSVDEAASTSDNIAEKEGEEEFSADGDYKGEIEVAEGASGVAEDDTETTEETWQAGITFSSLIAFFDATALESLKPMNTGGYNLPIEIIEMILDCIFDVKTHHACLKVSRDFRRICLKRPVLLDGVKLLQPLRATDSKEKSERQMPFLAEISTGETFEIVVHKLGFHWDADLYYIVAGNEWNRRSFSPGALISVRNLNMPAPFNSEKRESRDDDDRLQQWSREERKEREDNPWDKAEGRYDIMTRCDIKTLKEYWQRVAAIMFRDLVRGFGESVLKEDTDWLNDWLLPANTKQLVIHSDEYYHKGWSRYLFLRMRRASRYWDDLWDQLISEIKDLLPQEDKSMYVEKRKVKPLFGAANPEVILVVGLEVRLFKWDAQDATLTETDPKKVYTVTDKEDRKVIEGVLISAVDRLRAAEPKEIPGFEGYDSSFDDEDDNS